MRRNRGLHNVPPLFLIHPSHDENASSYLSKPIPADRTNIIAIAAGSDHDLMLKSDGTVISFGLNQYGQTDVPVGLSNVVAIACGEYHSLALLSNGSVINWGQYHDAGTYLSEPIPPNSTNIVAIAAGSDHDLMLKSGGTVITWGVGPDGQTNVPPGISNVVAVAAGKTHSVALVGDGPMPPPLVAENPIYTNGEFSVSVQSRSGKAYRLEYKDSLSDSNWTELPSQPGDGTPMRLLGPGTAPQRYFRVREL